MPKKTQRSSPQSRGKEKILAKGKILESYSPSQRQRKSAKKADVNKSDTTPKGPKKRATKKKTAKKTPKKTTKRVTKKKVTKKPSKSIKKPKTSKKSSSKKKVAKSKKKEPELEAVIEKSAYKAPALGPKISDKEARQKYLNSLSPEDRKKAIREKHKETVRKYKSEMNKASRDIYPIPVENIDWDRRLECKFDLKKDLETYYQSVFKLGWADYHLELLAVTQNCFLEVGVKHCFAVPRGGGKTAISRGSMSWGTKYGHKHYPVFIGSKDEAGQAALNFVKQHLYSNPLLRQDFPELSYPIQKIENRFSGARSQLYYEQPTSLIWSTGEIRYPSLLLEDETAQFYLDNDPDSLIWIPEYQRHIPASAGCYIETAGIDGSIRGSVRTHPITLEEVRPDIVLLDDVQKDQKAESPTSCQKMILIIDGAVEGMAGPEEKLSALKPCTVIRKGDVADTYLTTTEKPDWQGKRTQMVTKWPEGMTDYEITMDTEVSQLWNDYAEVRRKSLKLHGDIRRATEFYKKNQEVMDQGFEVSWPDRYVKKGINKELSAIQSAMNFRLHSPLTFPSEYQNIGRIDENLDAVMITAEQLSKKILHLKKFCVPADTQYIATFIDVQDEIFYLATGACSQEFTGIIPYYGNYPEVHAPVFTRNQTSGWNMLSRDFFLNNPTYRDQAIRSKSGKPKAPLNEKMYYNLKKAVAYAKSLEYIRQDGQDTVMHTQMICVDVRWGEVAETLKNCIADHNDPNIVPYLGFSIPPTNKQMEEYTRTGTYRSWLFEDQKHPLVKHCKWIYRLGEDGRYYLQADVDRLKDFLFSRLSVGQGGKGCISLYEDLPDAHRMFANQICESEYPEPVSAKGIEKNKWLERDGRPDNDWFDCCVGLMAMLSYLGANVPLTEIVDQVPSKPRKLSDIRRQKMAAKR